MIGINKGQPIAVIDQYGTILPFTTNGVDAVHCLKLGVTYIYDEATLKKYMSNNEKYHNQHDFENPKLFTQAERKLRIPAPPNHGRSESRIEIINPESVQLNVG